MRWSQSETQAWAWWPVLDHRNCAPGSRGISTLGAVVVPLTEKMSGSRQERGVAIPLLLAAKGADPLVG